jgi:Ca-activated chloride channel family protein
MTFIWPAMLGLLVLVPLGVVLYVFWLRKRKRTLAGYVNTGFQQLSLGTKPGMRYHLPTAIFMVGAACLVFAMARPQAVVNLPREEGTIMLVFDVSGSMAATDLAPTRLDAAKAAAQAFIQHLPANVQIGVVAFSDTGFTVQTPTSDLTAVSSAISRMVPEKGTSLANGITASLAAIAAGTSNQGPLLYSDRTPQPTPVPTHVPKGRYSPAVIILLSDGENNENPNPLSAAQQAADRGVRIYTVGIGSAAGTTVQINGYNIFTQLDESILQQIAQVTGGSYFNAQSAQDLKTIYGNLDKQLVIKPENMEITSFFAGGGLLVLLIGGLFSLLWFGRLP